MTPGVLGLLGFERPAWHADARCKEYPPGLFFPTTGDTTLEAARAVCSGCLVSAECLAWALAEGDHLAGIWAGTTPRQRRALRRGLVVSSVAPVGGPDAA